MLLPEIKPRKRSYQPAESNTLSQPESVIDSEFDFDSWNLFGCWKEPQKDRFGGGNSAPAVPFSQRQYDGDNQFDYCEVMVVR